VVKGDLTRRVMMCRLDAEMERPESRSFPTDILEQCKTQRAELIAAALTLTTGYQAAGCPDVGVDPLGGSSNLECLVRRPLIWAALPDPLGPTAETRSEDPERVAMLGLLTALQDTYGDETKTSTDIIDDAVKVMPTYSGVGIQYDHPGAQRGRAPRLRPQCHVKATGPRAASIPQSHHRMNAP
jgi:putative DNA primase/helicase